MKHQGRAWRSGHRPPISQGAPRKKEFSFVLYCISFKVPIQHTVCCRDIGSDRWNNKRIEVTKEQLSEIPTRTTPPEDPKYPGPLQLLATFGRAKLTLTLMFAMFFRSVLSNLFTQDASNDAGNPFINIGLFGLVRIWVPFVIVFLDRKVKRFGRRACFLVFQGSLLVILVVIVIIGLTGNLYGGSLRWLGLMGAALSASGSWMSIAQYMIEAYPTAVRGTIN